MKHTELKQLGLTQREISIYDLLMKYKSIKRVEQESAFLYDEIKLCVKKLLRYKVVKLSRGQYFPYSLAGACANEPNDANEPIKDNVKTSNGMRQVVLKPKACTEIMTEGDEGGVGGEEEGKTKYRSLISDVASVTLEVLRNLRPSSILKYWSSCFSDILGRTCTEGVPSVTTYGKIQTALRYLPCKSDILVVMEMSLVMRKEEVPYWKGAEIRDPTLGLFCAGERLAIFMEKIAQSEVWTKRRYQFAFVHYKGNYSKLSEVLTAKEYDDLLVILDLG